MPRPPRMFVADEIYHITARGSDRQAIFLFDADRLAFLERLAATVERHELACIAYCLMGNHYHLLIQPHDGSRVSIALQELNGGYSRHFNRTHGRSAHLFRHRFGARRIKDEAHLLATCRYIAHNPVRAGLCRDPADWPWSSHRATAGLAPTPPFLSETVLRDAFGGGPDWRQRYRDYVDETPLSVDNKSHTRHNSPLTATGA